MAFLITTFIILIIQYALILWAFSEGTFTTKKMFLLSFIPFFWFILLLNILYEGFIIRFKELK